MKTSPAMSAPRVGAGLSTLHDAASATRDALDAALGPLGPEGPDLVFLFVSPQFEAEQRLVLDMVVARAGGALVLGCSAGAYPELSEGALGIDPLSLDDTAGALELALTMGEEERRQRASLMKAAVERWTSRDWMRALREDLAEAAATRAHPVAQMTKSPA